MKNNIAYLLLIELLMVTLLGCGTVTPKNQPDMSMTEFNQIRNGMTYEQVTAIVGSRGEIVVETGNPGNPFYTVTYQFKGEGGMWGNANAQLTFQGGQLTTKAQMGIERMKYEEIGKLK